MKITSSQIADTQRVYYVDASYDILPSPVGARFATINGSLMPLESVEPVASTPSNPASASMTWQQPIAATVWTIHHNLGRFPQVQSLGSSLIEIGGLVTHIDTNTLTVEFNVPLSGIAILD